MKSKTTICLKKLVFQLFIFQVSHFRQFLILSDEISRELINIFIMVIFRTEKKIRKMKNFPIRCPSILLFKYTIMVNTVLIQLNPKL